MWPTSIEVLVADITERDAVERALAGVQIVVHLACTTVPHTSETARVYDVHSNIETALFLLERSVDAGVKRFVFASSGGTIYGPPQKLPIPEDHPKNPICSHGVMKLAIENYLGVFHHIVGLETIALRMSNPYGPGQGVKPQGFIGVLARRISEGQDIEVWGDGTVVRDFLSVHDVAEAFACVVAGRGVSGAYNVGSARGYSIAEVISEAEIILGRRISVRYLPGRAIDVSANVLDITKARVELGWEPAVSLRRGLQALLAVS